MSKKRTDSKMLRVTVDQVMSWNPCRYYTRERVKRLFAGRDKLTAMDILNLDIPAQDRLWAVLREEMIPADTLYEFACRCAEQTLLMECEAGREPDARLWAAIEIRRKWLNGEATDKELAAARAAAIDAARAAAIDAARAAARDAAWDKQIEELKGLIKG